MGDFMEKDSLNNFEENIFNMDRAGGNTAVCNIGGLVTLNENISYDEFCYNFRILVAENKALRKNVDNSEKVYFTDDINFPIDHLYFDSREEVEKWADLSIKEPFTKEDKWLFKICYITVKDKNFLFLNVHHIICDGMGMVNICRKFQEILKRIDKKIIVNNDVNKESISKEKYEKAVAFFDKYIGNENAFCTKENSLDYEAGVQKVLVEPALYNELKLFSEKNKISVGMVIIGSIYKYFSTVKNRDKVVFGSVFLNRNNKNINDISMVANTMPVVIESVENSFSKTCFNIGKTIFRLMKYGFYSQKDLYNNQHIHSNLYDISISYRNEKLIPALKIGKIRELFNGYCDSNMRFYINEKENSVEIQLHYKKSLFSDFYAECLLDRILHITKQGIKDTPLDEISIFTEKDSEIYEKTNSTYYNYDKGNVQGCFDEMVKKQGNNIALIDENIALTFEEFNQYSNSVVDFLMENNVEKGSTVGVQIERSAFLPIILMGILKAGCVYMPISVHNSKETSEFFRKKCSIVITDKNKFCRSKNNVVDSNKYAYTMYTSGSSGVPKGVKISADAIYNRMCWMHRKYNLARRILQKTTNVFDVSMWELLSPAFGGCLYMLNEGDEKYPDKILDAILKYKIQVIHFVPSMLKLFLDYCIKNNLKIDCIEDVFASGEKLTLPLIQGFRDVFVNAKLHNLYGPTECAVDVTYYDVTFSEENIPIGLPVDNCKIKIMSNETVLPPMESGEICIFGVQTGEYTDKNISGFKTIDGENVYYTGDIGYIGKDGNIYYKGRKDRQLKVKGIRVEPESIEKAFMSVSGVSDVRVFAYKDMLCAVYTGNCNNINSVLKEKLNYREMPTIIKNIGSIPLSKNGKTDYKKIYDFVLENEKTDINGTENEKKLIDVIARETEIKNIMPEDDLFNKGIDSLGVIKVVNAVSESDIKFSDFYEFRTVRKIVENINSRKMLTVLKSNNSKKALVCVPYGGGEPQIFLSMCEYIKDFDVLGVYTSFFNKDITVENIGENIGKELCKLGYGSFIVIGICVGSVVALEIAKYLESNRKVVDNVFIGASLPTKAPRILGKTINPWSFVNRKYINYFLEKLGGEQVCFEKVSEKIFRNDTNRFFKYVNKENRINIKGAVILIFGENDKITLGYSNKAKKWKNYINDFSLITLKNAGHYFIKSKAKEVAEIIEKSSKIN